MANSVVDYYRQRNPGDNRPDDAITVDYVSRYGLDALRDYPDLLSDYERISKSIRKATAPSLPKEFTRAVSSGIDQTQAKLYDTAALAGDIVGSDALTQFGEEGYKRNLQEAAQNAPTISSVSDIESPSDAVRYALGVAGANLPQMGLTFAGGLGGGLLAGVPGAVLGAGAAGFTQMQNRGELLSTPGVDKSSVIPTALGVGLVGAALEEIPVVRALGILVPKAFGTAAREVAERYLPRVLAEVPKQAILEGGTEVAQEITTMAGELYANRDNPNFQLTPQEVQSRIANNFIGGALLGGAVGGIEAIPGGRHDQTSTGASAQETAPVNPPAPEAAVPGIEGRNAPSEADDAAIRAAREYAATALSEEEPSFAGQPEATVAQTATVQPGANPERSDLLEKGNEEGRQERLLNEAAGPVTTAPQLAQALPPNSYDEAQSRIEAIEDGLSERGVDVIHLYNPNDPRSKDLVGATGWNPMPDNLVEAYKERDAIGAAQLKQSVSDISSGLETIGLNQKEINRVLDKYGIHTYESDALAQQNAVKFALSFAKKDINKQAEALAYALAAERNEKFDELEDISDKALRDAASAVQVIRSYLGLSGRSDIDLKSATISKPPVKSETKQLPTPPVKELAAPNPEKGIGTAAEQNPAVPRVPFDLEKIDFDNSSLRTLTGRRGGEKAFFELTKDNEKFTTELGERLTRDAAAQGGTSKATTRRVAFFEYQETGEVFGLPVWKTSSSRDGIVYRVTDPFNAKNARLQTLMERGFIPVASARWTEDLKGTDKSSITTFDDFQQFEQQVLQPARERMAQNASYAAEMPEHMRAQGFDENGDALETLSPERGTKKGAGGESSGLYAGDEEDTVQSFQDALVEELSKTRDLTRDGVEQALERAGSKPENVQAFMGAMRALLKDETIQEQAAKLEAPEAQRFLLGKLADKVHERIREEINASVESPAVGHGGGSLALGGDYFSVRTRRPDGRATSGETKARFTAVQTAALDAGLKLDIVQAIGDEIGSFSGKARKVTLALHDAENPSADNLRLLLHELAHAVSMGLDEASRAAVHLAVDAASDEELQIEGKEAEIKRSVEAAVAANPALSQAGVRTEERLAQHLEQRGFDKPAAQNIAARIVRAVKALYYRMAMALQKIMGRPVSSALAMDYVRNRFDQLAAGDRQGLFEFLIPPLKASGGDLPDYYSIPGGLTQERLSADPKIEAQTKIATWNEQLDLEKEINQALAEREPQVANAAREAGQTPAQWFREALGLPDPEQLIKSKLQEIDPETGLVIKSEPEFRIKDFKAEQNLDLAYQDALAHFNRLHTKVSTRIDGLNAKISKLEKERENASRRFNAANEAPSLPLPEAQEKARQARIQKWKEEIQSIAKERDRLAVELSAAQQVVGLFRKRINELEGPLQAHKAFVYGHNVSYLVPMEGGGFEPKTLKLDANGEVTKQSEVQADIGRMHDFLATAPKDGLYYRIQAQIDEFTKNQVSTDARKTGYTMAGLITGDIATQMKAQGTPLFRLIAQRVNKFESQKAFLRGAFESRVNEAERARGDALRIANTSAEYFQQNFYDPAVEILEGRRDIAERFPNNFAKQLDAAFEVIRERLLDRTVNPDRAALIRSRADEFFPALRRDIEANYAVAKFALDHNALFNVHVQDEALGEDIERKPINRGVLTIPQTLSAYFRTVFDAMRSTWAAANSEFSEFSKTYNEQGPEAAAASVAKFFQGKTESETQDIITGFWKALLFEVKNGTPFYAPILEDGVTRPKANPGFIRRAFEESGGEPVRFFEVLHRLHDGKENVGDYIQKNLTVLARHFAEMRKVMEQTDPTGLRAPKTLANMIPGFMIHSREVEHWPSGWVTHVAFDSHTAPRIIEKMAAQLAFGPEQRDLIKLLNDALGEYETAIKKLQNAEARVQKTNPSKKKKVVRAALEKEVGGPDELKRLERIRKLGKFINGGFSIQNQLITFLTNRHSVNRDLGFLNQLSSFFASAMVNQPGSALSQLAEVGNGLLVFGGNKQGIRHAVKTAISTGSELGFGLVRSLGFSLERSDREFKRAYEYGQGDPEASRKMREIWKAESPFDSESVLAGTLRKVRQTVTAPIGGGGDYISLRPFGLFTQVNAATHIAPVVNFIKEVQDMVSRGMEWAKANPLEFTTDLADLSPRDWAKKIGLGSGEVSGFARVFQRALDDHAIDYYTLVKNGLKYEERGADIIDKPTWIALSGMWVKEASSQSNLSTMSSAAFNNSVLRFMMPLLGWAWMRARTIAGLRLNERGEGGIEGLQALSKGLLGLTALAIGGLGVSALVDLYNEELLKKRRNLRRLSLDQDMPSLAYAVLEHSARVGTFGLLGDLVNGLTNVATGQGDNRTLSMDGRVVFANSAIGLIRTISNFVNQGFEADYMNVIRPAMFSLGGNGLLQYVDLANGVLGLDNQESRAVRRTNAGNWLRVAGREAKMEIRTMDGGYSSPTPLTPWITKMQLAALGGDSAEFNEAYRSAMEEARALGKDDPFDAVRKAYEARNPLRSVYRTLPTEQDYRRILSLLPDQGREDVTEAINLFNRYGATIGATPFDGRAVKQFPSRSPEDDFTAIMRARSHAATFY